jgi:hypothetical protein
MNDEKLAQLNDMSEKIKTKKRVLRKIDTLYKKNDIVVTDNNITLAVELPEELRNVFFTLLRDYHQKQLDALEKEFEEM